MRVIFFALVLVGIFIFLLSPKLKEAKNDGSAMASLIRLKTFKDEMKNYYTKNNNFPTNEKDILDFTYAKYLTWKNNELHYEFENHKCLKIRFDSENVFFIPTNINKNCKALYELLTKSNLLIFKDNKYFEKSVWNKNELINSSYQY